MVHLLTAYKYDPKASVAFLVGNIVPDIISEWQEKDRIHLRDGPDRLCTLKELAETKNMRNDFEKGIIILFMKGNELL